MDPARLQITANCALAGGQIIFGAGNVVAKIGLDGINPIMFALIREGIAGPLLLIAACCSKPRARLKLKDTWRFLITGVTLFLTNLLYIVGVKLSGSTTAAIWQPVQPVIMTLMAVILRYEQATWMKTIGIAIACSGCLAVSLYDMIASSAGSSQGDDQSLGNVIFALQSLAVSSFWISEKPLLLRYSPITVLGWSYIIASMLMVITATIVNEVPVLLHSICDDCHHNGWGISPGAWLGIAYWVLVGSLFGYFLMTWGNQHVNASLVGIYTVIQPVVSLIAALALIATSAPPHYGLRGATFGDLGAIGIFLGLAIVVYDNRANSLHNESLLASVNTCSFAG